MTRWLGLTDVQKRCPAVTACGGTALRHAQGELQYLNSLTELSSSIRFTAAPDHPRMEHLESYVRRRETSVSVEPTESLSVHPRTEAVDIGIRSNANPLSTSLAIEVSRNLDGQDQMNVMGEKTGPTGSHQAQSRPFAPFGTTRELFGSGDRPGSLRSEEEGQSQQLHSDFNLPTTYRGNDIASGGDTSHIQGDAVIQDDGRSFGTLLISRGGRSKYLGPTAASEWLQDVSLTRCSANETCSKRSKTTM